MTPIDTEWRYANWQRWFRGLDPRLLDAADYVKNNKNITLHYRETQMESSLSQFVSPMLKETSEVQKPPK